MRIISIILFWLLLFVSYAIGDIGIVCTYNIVGKSLGNTRIRGQVKALFKKNSVKIETLIPNIIGQ